MRILPLEFISRVATVDDTRVGTVVTWNCPVAGFPPLTGVGRTYVRAAGDRRETIVYPPQYRAQIKVKRLHETPGTEFADYDLALAEEFLRSTCLYGEAVTVYADSFAGVRGTLVGYQSSSSYTLTPSRGSPQFLQTEFALDILQFTPA